MIKKNFWDTFCFGKFRKILSWTLVETILFFVSYLEEYSNFPLWNVSHMLWNIFCHEIRRDGVETKCQSKWDWYHNRILVCWLTYQFPSLFVKGLISLPLTRCCRCQGFATLRKLQIHPIVHRYMIDHSKEHPEQYHSKFYTYLTPYNVVKLGSSKLNSSYFLQFFAYFETNFGFRILILSCNCSMQQD